MPVKHVYETSLQEELASFDTCDDTFEKQKNNKIL